MAKQRKHYTSGEIRGDPGGSGGIRGDPGRSGEIGRSDREIGEIGEIGDSHRINNLHAGGDRVHSRTPPLDGMSHQTRTCRNDSSRHSESGEATG